MYIRKIKRRLRETSSVYRGWYSTKATQRARDGSAMRSPCWHNDPFVPEQPVSTIRAYLHFQPLLIVASLLKVCAGTGTKTRRLRGRLVSARTRWFCLFVRTDTHLGPGGGKDSCRNDTLFSLLLTISPFRRLPRQSIPFSHASVSFPYSPEDYRAEDSSGSDVLVVHVGRRGGGGFHSDTEAMKRLDQWTVPCMPVCVWESMKFSSIAGGWDTEEPFMIYYLDPMAFTPKSEQPAKLSSLHAFVVTLQSIPGCDEREKNTPVIAFLSTFSHPLTSDSPLLASNFPKVMRLYLMSPS